MGLISSYSHIFTINSVRVGVCLYYDLTVYQQKDMGADISELYQTRLKYWYILSLDLTITI